MSHHDHPTETNWHQAFVSERAISTRLRLALQDIFLMMDESILVRDTTHDGKPDFALRMMSVVERLKSAHDAMVNSLPAEHALEKEGR